MRCQDVERLLIETEDKDFGPADDQGLAGHLAQCAGCRAKLAAWKSLRLRLSHLSAPPLSPGLEQKVRRLCYAEIDRIQRPAPVSARPGESKLPGFLWPIFGALVLISVVLLFSGLQALVERGLWTPQATLALILIVQNGLTLLLAPLLLARRPENGVAI
ncbi:MAG: hypothetical protein WCB96_07855 [Candidatus Aminicenantales bacterium]